MLQRWENDGNNMIKFLEADGFEVKIDYADDKVPNQISQIENMITAGCKILIVAPIDGSALNTVLNTAKSKGIPVVSYDRLLMGTDAVKYYVTFDNEKVGEMQGQYIIDKLGLATGAGPFNIELFAGPTSDNNAKIFFGGAMKVLQPYIDSGKLVVKSGQTKFEQCSTAWETVPAQTRMETILSQAYSSGDKVQAVLCNNDALARGVANALKSAGYAPGANYPVITGQDCETASVKNIVEGTQSMSVFKDTRTLSETAAKLVKSILDNKPDAPNGDPYNNGVVDVPSYLCKPVDVDVTNYQSLLIDSGYYTADQIK
jgi:putative multiple sugar transport system substrate-binding protein